ncbi:MAG: type VI secretion system protein TssA [Bryobacter sp.]|nr:type VI secretion system protein TssA [Bryobacter sp.]
MPLRDDILEPVAGDNPAGRDLRYHPIYDQIKEARREEEAFEQGVWQTAIKSADWVQVVKLCSEALAKQSKDLQLAAWLTEALLRREGLPGLASGLRLLAELLERFWDTLYPELEDGDAEMRSVPLAWVASRLDTALQRAPLAIGLSSIEFEQARFVPSEQDAESDYAKKEQRDLALQEGRATPEMVSAALKATPAAYFAEQQQTFAAIQSAIDRLDALCNEKMPDYAPGFSSLRDQVEKLAATARYLEQQAKAPTPTLTPAAPTAPSSGGGLWQEFDHPAEPETPQETTSFWEEPSASAPPPAHQAPPPSPAYGGSQSVDPADTDDCAHRLAALAAWLRREQPRSPAAYLLLRGWRWGELRALGQVLDPEWLDAPPTEIRQRLRRHAQEENWSVLLETGEEAMALPCGRAWLDLQRYTVTACEQLGEEYTGIAQAVLDGLASLLAAYPSLLELALSDDTPCANAATREFLQARGCLPGSRPAPAAAPRNGSSLSDETLVAEALRRGRPEQALEIVSRGLARETSGRGRFERKTQMARILIAAGRRAMARPLLEELRAEIAERRLDAWESAAMLIEPLVLLYGSLEDDPGAQQEIYQTIFRLDPVKAFELGGS